MGVLTILQSKKFVTAEYLADKFEISEEANALVLMETTADKFGDQSIKQYYETALSKIKAVLKDSQKDKVEHLHSQIKIYKHPSEKSDLRYLSEIQNAIINKVVLKN